MQWNFSYFRNKLYKHHSIIIRALPPHPPLSATRVAPARLDVAISDCCRPEKKWFVATACYPQGRRCYELFRKRLNFYYNFFFFVINLWQCLRPYIWQQPTHTTTISSPFVGKRCLRLLPFHLDLVCRPLKMIFSFPFECNTNMRLSTGFGVANANHFSHLTPMAFGLIWPEMSKR